METPLYVILLVLFCALLAAFGQICFKLASRDFSFNPMTWLKNKFFIFGVLLYAISALLFVYSLKNGNLSVLYPVIASSYIWTIFCNKNAKRTFSFFQVDRGCTNNYRNHNNNTIKLYVFVYNICYGLLGLKSFQKLSFYDK
jgi:multidrug transporter EmrE-like cation transporter